MHAWSLYSYTSLVSAGAVVGHCLIGCRDSIWFANNAADAVSQFSKECNMVCSEHIILSSLKQMQGVAAA